MGRTKLHGLFLGVVLALVCFALPLDGLSVEGRKALAPTVMTVVFWAFQVSHSGYIAGLYLVLLIILKVAKPTVVLAPLATSSTFLIMGAYLLAASVRSSELGERIAYFMLCFVTSYRSLIIVIYLLTFVLSLIIPHAWPRALLIMSVMLVVINTAQIGVQDARQIGFAVFASSLIVHLLLGSVLSVMGVAIPALLAFVSGVSIDPLVIVLWAYTVIGSHYILPFHHMNVLVGVGEGNGLYSQKETIRLGIPLIAVVYFITVVVQTLWWKALGLIA